MKKKIINYVILILALSLILFTSNSTKQVYATPYNGHEIYTYYANYCTWYACGRAWEVLGVDIDKHWENAYKWAESAKKAGYTVDYIPAKNTIAVWPANNVYTAGHVAFVEDVNGNNMTISEYNYSVSMGYSSTTISTTAQRVYGAPPQFIHLVEEPIQEEENTIIRGDLNKDKQVNATDSSLILDIYINGGATKENYELGDLNSDNILNSSDAAIVLDIFKASK